MWLALLLTASATTPRDDRWADRTENAAVRTREAATTLADTASAIARAGRLERLAPLRSDVDEVVRRTRLLARVTEGPE